MGKGRPSEYSQATADEICERIAKGESLRSITSAGRDDFIPCESTVRNWLAKGEAGDEPFAGFLRQYARAREHQADAKFDEAWEIAQKATPENVAVARLQIDTIKWQASKLVPKKYGDKLDVNHGGDVGVSITYVSPEAPPLSGEDYES